MYKIKSTLIVAGFIIFCFVIVFYAYYVELNPNRPKDIGNNHNNHKEEKSYFQNANYFIIKNSKPALHLIADRLDIRQKRGITQMTNPHGEAYTKELVPVFYKGDKGQYDNRMAEIILENNVTIFTDESELKAQKAIYLTEEDFFKAFTDVKTKNISNKTKDEIYVDSDKAHSWPGQKKSIYFGNVVGKIDRYRPYEPTIYFWSDRLNSDVNKSHIELIGKVRLKKQEVKARSLRGEIFLENYNKKLKYYALYDDVVVKELITLQDGSKMQRTSYSELLEGLAAEEKIILTGHPKVYQGKEVITGNKITLLENNEVVEVDEANTRLIIK